MAAGERVILPAVRDAGPQTFIVADGFSCREQIAHGTGRRALHLAQVLQLAALGGQGPDGRAGGTSAFPEEILPVELGGIAPRPRSTVRLAVAGAAAVVTVIAIRSLRGGSHG
jgi:hypothetical protein